MLKSSGEIDKKIPFGNCSNGINFDHSPRNIGAMMSIEVLSIQF